MLTQDQMNTLESTAQDILDERPFDKIRSSIDEIATAAAEDQLGRLRVRKLPVGGAFVHAVGSRVMETIEQNPQPEWTGGSGMAAYNRYQELTSGIEESVGQEVIAELKDKEGTFQDAFTYFDSQMGLFWETEKVKADHNRIGKVTKEEEEEPPTSEELLSGWLADNTITTATSLMLHQAIVLCREEGHLPSGDELGDYLREKREALGRLVHAPGQIAQHAILGRTLAQKHFRHVRYNNNAKLGFTRWCERFRECLKTGSLSALAQEMAPSLQRHPWPSFHLFGHWVAQLRLRPFEYSERRPEAARLAAASFFGRQGVALQDGAFKLGDYQILRIIEVGQKTIFADKDCRAALELLASM